MVWTEGLPKWEQIADVPVLKQKLQAQSMATIPSIEKKV
jgi:hypothetical protein